MPTNRRHIEVAASVMSLALMVGAIWFLWHYLGDLDWSKVRSHLATLPVSQLAAVVACLLIGYIALLFYDLLGLRYIEFDLSRRRALLASWVSHALADTIALPMVNVWAPRFRFYTAWGMRQGQLFRLVTYAGLGTWAGVLLVAGATLWAWPPHVPILGDLSEPVVRVFGVLLLGALMVYLLACAGRERLRLFGHDIPLPSKPLLAGQVTVGVFEWTAQAMLVWQLLPADAQITLPAYAAVFFLSVLMSMIGHVPVGLGVFDTGMVILLGDRVAAEPLIAALIGYRLIYHVVPLGFALVALGVYEIRSRRTGGQTS